LLHIFAISHAAFRISIFASFSRHCYASRRDAFLRDIFMPALIFIIFDCLSQHSPLLAEDTRQPLSRFALQLHFAFAFSVAIAADAATPLPPAAIYADGCRRRTPPA